MRLVSAQEGMNKASFAAAISMAALLLITGQVY